MLVDGLFGVVTVPGAGAAAAATMIEPWDLRVRRVSVAIDDLPIELDGFRIVQISDTHLGPRIPEAFIAAVVARARELGPDLFVLTGDYIYSDAGWIEPGARLFGPLVESGIPVLGVLGNHDWWADGPAMSRALTGVGVRMIDNTRIFIDAATRTLADEPPHRGLCVAGLGDLLTDTLDVEAAFRGVPDDMPRLLLEHVPDAAEDPRLGATGPPRFSPGFPARVDLMLSGHTHGGQVRIPGLGTPIVPSRFGQKYAGGLVDGPRFRVLISRGVGMSILPVRFGVPPEIGEITLRVSERARSVEGRSGIDRDIPRGARGMG